MHKHVRRSTDGPPARLQRRAGRDIQPPQHSCSDAELQQALGAWQVRLPQPGLHASCPAEQGKGKQAHAHCGLCCKPGAPCRQAAVATSSSVLPAARAKDVACTASDQEALQGSCLLQLQDTRQQAAARQLGVRQAHMLEHKRDRARAIIRTCLTKLQDARQQAAARQVQHPQAGQRIQGASDPCSVRFFVAGQCNVADSNTSMSKEPVWPLLAISAVLERQVQLARVACARLLRVAE